MLDALHAHHEEARESPGMQPEQSQTSGNMKTPKLMMPQQTPTRLRLLDELRTKADMQPEQSQTCMKTPKSMMPRQSPTHTNLLDELRTKAHEALSKEGAQRPPHLRQPQPLSRPPSSRFVQRRRSRFVESSKQQQLGHLPQQRNCPSSADQPQLPPKRPELRCVRPSAQLLRCVP